MLSFFKSRKYITIGDVKLDLDLDNKHEKEYYNSIKNNDYFISEKLIKKGDKVLDLGANIGFTSLIYLLFGASEVYAFEPIKELFKRIQSLKTTKIKPFNVAISNYEGESEMFMSSTHNQGHSLNKQWPQQFKDVFVNYKSQKVNVITLDRMFPHEIFNFVKIDVEGAEREVIEGGEIFFKRNSNTVIQIEIYEQQFNETNNLLKMFYKYTFVPQIADNKVIFKNIDDFDKKSFIDFNGPPNYIYTNKVIS